MSEVFKSRWIWAVGLSLLGLAGNYFSYPIFLNIDFLFGSIFAMLAMQLLGLRWGLLCAAVTACYTYFLWNEAYAFILMTAEVGVAGVLMRRYRLGLVWADVLYWVALGMPLGFFFYQQMLEVAPSSTYVILTKQAINGIANTLTARLLYVALVKDPSAPRMTLPELVSNLLTAFILLPAMLMLGLDSRADFTRTDQEIRTHLYQQSVRMTRHLTDWIQDRTDALTSLSQLASTLTPQQMQLHLEQARASDHSFLRIGMRDTESVVVAYAPPVDAAGVSNVGKKFPERPYIEQLRERLKPMLAEVVMGRIDQPEPVAILLTPVLRQGVYAGYINSVLRIDAMRQHLDAFNERDMFYYTLLDSKGQIVLTSRQDQKMMQPLLRGNGMLQAADDHVLQWIPTLAPNTSISERWRSSYYVTQTTLGHDEGWQLVLEQSVAPFQKQLYDRYSAKLLVLFFILLAALGLAQWLGRRISATLERLSALTRDLPQRLHAGTTSVSWPRSRILQTHNLIENFRLMADSLTQRFQEIGVINATLEHKVQERTAALQQSEQRFRLLVENSHDIIFTLDAQGVFTFVSPSWSRALGHSVSEVLGRSLEAFVHPEDFGVCQRALQTLLRTGQSQIDIEYRVRHLDGSWCWYSANALPLRDEAGKVVGFEGVAKDIDQYRKSQEAARQQAFYDVLTRLPNRRLLRDRVALAIAGTRRSSSFGALLFLDLDDFKPINDIYGHATGDLLLGEVARRLLGSVRQVDTVARFGGDEFIVLLVELAADRAESQAQTLRIAEKIRAALDEPYPLPVESEGVPGAVFQHHCPVSIGATVFGQGSEFDGILKQADSAMYQAKSRGGNCVCFFDAAEAATPLDPAEPAQHSTGCEQPEQVQARAPDQ